MPFTSEPRSSYHAPTGYCVENGTFRNHRPLLGFFDPLVSLSSLVMARQRGILPRAPMFLEIRDGLSPVSWSALHASAEGAVMSSTHPQSS